MSLSGMGLSGYGPFWYYAIPELGFSDPDSSNTHIYKLILSNFLTHNVLSIMCYFHFVSSSVALTKTYKKRKKILTIKFTLFA